MLCGKTSFTGTYLGIDYGTKKTGLAYSLEGFCFPLCIVPTAHLFKEIQSIVINKHITGFVIGIPQHIDGKKSTQEEKVSLFVQKLSKKHTDMPIWGCSEALSSIEAYTSLCEVGFYKRKKYIATKKQPHFQDSCDDIAAQIILTRFFDQKNLGGTALLYSPKDYDLHQKNK